MTSFHSASSPHLLTPLLPFANTFHILPYSLALFTPILCQIYIPPTVQLFQVHLFINSQLPAHFNTCSNTFPPFSSPNTPFSFFISLLLNLHHLSLLTCACWPLQVSQWLVVQGLEGCVGKFQELAITGPRLLNLDARDLKNLGLATEDKNKIKRKVSFCMWLCMFLYPSLPSSTSSPLVSLTKITKLQDKS